MTEKNETAKEADGPKFSIGKIYLKDVSLEAPNSPAAFLEAGQGEPKVSLQYSTETADLSNGTYEVVLVLTVTVTEGDKTIFLVEVKQGGIFLIRNIGEQQRFDKLVKGRCPRILFPYAREAIDNLIVKAGVPPLMLAPISFSGK
jgi:preprotein translocase subunit SecB